MQNFARNQEKANCNKTYHSPRLEKRRRLELPIRAGLVPGGGKSSRKPAFAGLTPAARMAGASLGKTCFIPENTETFSLLTGSLSRTTAALVAPSLPRPPLEMLLGDWRPASFPRSAPLAVVFLGLASYGVDATSCWAVPLGFRPLCKLMAGAGAALHN